MKLSEIKNGISPEWAEKGYELPKFDIEAVRAKTHDQPTWVHFGAGNIFRAFPAAILNEALNSGKYDRGQMMKLVRGKSGLLAHLGTSDAMEVERRIAAGDEKARMVYDAMLYTAAKSIGALAAAADGRIDRIILTGGIAHSRYVTDYLTQKVGFIAPVEVMAGEFEMEALAAGASRVLAGQETPHRFRDLLKGE